MAAFLVMGASAHVVFEHELHGLHGERGHPALALGGMGYRWPIISRMKQWCIELTWGSWVGKRIGQEWKPRSQSVAIEVNLDKILEDGSRAYQKWSNSGRILL